MWFPSGVPFYPYVPFALYVPLAHYEPLALFLPACFLSPAPHRGQAFEKITIIRMRDRALPWEIFTVSDQVTVDQVDVYSASFERLYANAEIRVVDELPAGEYFLCFHTTILGPYSEKAGRYTFTTDFTIYKAKLN